jgi:hypothetical protein
MSRVTEFEVKGVTLEERKVLDRAAKNLGYRNLPHLITYNGCSSLEEFLRDFNFTSVRDFFFGFGWYERLEPFRRNGKHTPKSSKKTTMSRIGKPTSRAAHRVIA